MDKDIRDQVKDYYGGIAKKSGSGCGCSGSGCCGKDSQSKSFYGSDELNAIPDSAANMSLGCANPHQFAKLQPGEKVLDLGSGGGIDVLLAARAVGDEGYVYGLDMTDEMLSLAESNRKKAGAENVRFIKGYLEDIPLEDNTVDVIMSNCVINLSEDKEKALAEAWRVLKPGGRVAVADIVAIKPVGVEIREQAKLWASCVGGALEVKDYRDVLGKVGFVDIDVEPTYVYSKEVIENMLTSDALNVPGYEIPGMDWDKIDSLFAGAHVRARKPV